MSIVAGTLHHTCFVVHDLEKTARAMVDRLGIGPWAVWSLETERGRVRGRDVRFSFRVALAEVGNASYELISPLGADSVYVEHLRDRGEGFHHTCIAFDDLDQMRQAKADLSSEGLEAIQSGWLGDIAEFHYFQVDELASPVELLYLDAEALPAPELVIE